MKKFPLHVSNNLLLMLLILFFSEFSFVNNLQAKSKCIITPTDSTYKPNGPYSVICDSIINEKDDDDVSIFIFRPEQKKDLSPVIILCHQFGNRSPENYYSLIYHLVSKGFIVFYPSSFVIGINRNRTGSFRVSLENIEHAVKKVSHYVDTTRIGFVGHGTGAGAIPALARKCGFDKKWGKNGLFLYISSPWYMYSFDKRHLETFPDSANMIIQVFENDYVNDPQIAIDIFKRLKIPRINKRFFIMYDDKNERCKLKTSFSIPEGSIITPDSTDFIDTYAIYRVIDALADYSFLKDTNAYNFAFGKPGEHYYSMGKWSDGKNVKPMTVTDSPYVNLIDRNMYINPWLSTRNPQLEESDFKTSRKILRNYRKKTVQSITTFITAEIKNKNENSFYVDSLENPITNDFGCDGSYKMQSDTVEIPYESKERVSDKMPVFFFTPAGLRTPSPVIIFIHGYIGQNPDEFEPLLRHIVSKGYTVIYPTYPFFPKADDPEKVMDKYNHIYSGILKAAKILSWRIDTTRVGFFGQSFGAGTIPAVAYRTLVNNNWGTNGAFLFSTAPWYSFDITADQLKKIPSNVKMVLQVYNDDRINDHAMAIDIFNSIPIAESEKEYITLYSDSVDGYSMQANHFVPYGPKNIYGELNFLDYFGIYRIFDALAEYAFTGSQKAKLASLGNESIKELYMGEFNKERPFHPALLTDLPKAIHQEKYYLYGWNNTLNPRLEK